jgi:hypothetical protein
MALVINFSPVTTTPATVTTRAIIDTGDKLLTALQRKNAENWKQIFPEKEYRGLSPNFNIQVSVSELYIPTMELPFLLEEKCGLILGIYKSLTDT